MENEVGNSIFFCYLFLLLRLKNLLLYAIHCLSERPFYIERRVLKCISDMLGASGVMRIRLHASYIETCFYFTIFIFLTIFLQTFQMTSYIQVISTLSFVQSVSLYFKNFHLYLIFYFKQQDHLNVLLFCLLILYKKCAAIP